MEPSPPTQKQQLIVWWVLWAAFQVGIVFIYHFVGSSSSAPVRPPSEPELWQAGLIPFFLSLVCRWIVLPRFKRPQQALPVFVLGIAMAETTCFLGIFVFPAHKTQFFAMSVLGIFQFIPVFASRYFSSSVDG